MVDIENALEETCLKREAMYSEKMTLENIQAIMMNFGKLYDVMDDIEKKSMVSYFIKEIQIYPNDESKQILKSIEFNFPVYKNGKEVRKLLLSWLEKSLTHISTLTELSQVLLIQLSR